MSRKVKRTTDPGYENRNGQIVVRNTRLPGTDFGRDVYELRCKHCGHHYGANGSDIHQRKVPVAPGRSSGPRVPRGGKGNHDVPAPSKPGRRGVRVYAR
jgi:hypothetical protein